MNHLSNTLLMLLSLSCVFSCAQKNKVENNESAPSAYTGLGRDSINKDTLKKYSPTSLPEEMVRKVRSGLDIQSPGLGMLHPNGRQVFFTWRVTGQTQVWRVDGPQAFPVQMTGGKDATYLVDITPDGRWLILSRDEDGQENPGVFLQDPNGGPLIKVFMKPKVQASHEFTSADSQWLYFHANDKRPDSYTIYRYNLKTQQTETVFDEPGTWGVGDHRDSGELLLVKATGSIWREYYELNPKTKNLTPVLGQNEKEDYTVLYSQHPGEFIVQTPKLGEFSRIYRYKQGKFQPVSPEMPFPTESFSMDRQKKRIVYQVNENGYMRLKAVEASTFKEIKLPNFEGAVHTLAGTFSRDGKKIMLGIVKSQSPRSSYSYDWQSGKLTSWVTPSVPEINLKKFVASTLEYYPTRDGAKIPMFVRRPSQCEKSLCPVVVHFHGGPEGQSTPGFSVFSQLFVDEGIIFVEPNVRGSEGYGKTWLNSDNGEKRLQVISDIEDCALFIKKNWAQGAVAPKVGVMGWSYGGYSTLMAMTRFAGAYDAGVALVGMSNLYTFLQNTAPYRRHLRTSEYGDPDTQKDILLQLSPITYIDRIKAPLMIVQGANDPRVPVGEALQIHEALQKKNISSSLIIFADEGHGSQKKENQVLELGHTVQFFKTHLFK